MGGRNVHSNGRGGVLSSWVPTALGMALQCRGWPHGAGGDGKDALRWPDVTALSCVGMG
jgi:hypothetical protein